MDLSAADPWRAESQDPDYLSGACRPSGQPLASPATRNRVHAEPERGHADVYADDVAGALGDQGSGDFADAEQDHQDLSRSRVGLWQVRSRRDRNRSSPHQDGRNAAQSESDAPR